MLSGRSASRDRSRRASARDESRENSPFAPRVRMVKETSSDAVSSVLDIGSRGPIDAQLANSRTAAQSTIAGASG